MIERACCWAYLLAGCFVCLRVVPWAHVEHYAIVGPTRVGRILGPIVVAVVTIVLWPIVWRAARARAAARSGRYEDRA